MKFVTFLTITACLLAQGFLSAQEGVAVVKVAAPATQGIKWYSNYNEALAQAKKENKPLFLYFTGSDWCGWCKKMESEIFATREFSSTAGTRFIFVDVDFPMSTSLPADIKQQNQALKEKYGVTGYPTVVIIDSNEKFIGETGYRPGGGSAYAEYISGLLNR